MIFPTFHSLTRTLLLPFLLLSSGSALYAELEATIIAEAAKSQIGKTISYDPSYQTMAYPNGDISLEKGVCTDVVIRALRTSLNADLQKLVHQDMKSHFTQYPKIWGLTKTDRNIDHRRVPNLQTYFKRKGYSMAVTKEPADYLAGDIVTCLVPPRLPHIMIVSDTKARNGTPLVIHNIGSGTQEEDKLFAFKITGHYRIPIK